MAALHNDSTNRDLYILAVTRLLELTDRAETVDFACAFAEMGPSDFLGNLTDGQLTGAIAVINWVMDYTQFRRGQEHKNENNIKEYAA
jgi:hypothetical protein